MSCNSCNPSLKNVFNAKQKLGKCLFCIIASVIGTIFGWSAFISFFITSYNSKLIWILFWIAFAFTLLLSAHGIAYFIRNKKSKTD